jgi:uncharacterized protein (DUF58 family)
MDTTALRKKLKTIELKTRGRSQDVFAGQYQSAFKGRGMSFSEVRSYQVGDDVRNIDWNVTARFQAPYVKVFEEEREMVVFLIIDVSGSMFFGSGIDSKWAIAAEVAATIGFSAIKKNDKVGAIFVSDKVEGYVPPKKGFDHMHRILHQFLTLDPTSKKTDLSMGLNYVLKLHKQRMTCIVISDFISMDALQVGFSTIAKKHDVIAIQTINPAEVEIPKLGFVRLLNSETGRITWMDTSSPSIREKVRTNFNTMGAQIKQSFEALKIDFTRISSGEDVFLILRQLFQSRV